MIQENQDRDLENEDQRGRNIVSKKGNTQGYSEIGDETRTRRGRGEDEYKAERVRRRGDLVMRWWQGSEVTGWRGGEVMW